MSIGFQFTSPIKHRNSVLETLQQLSQQFHYQFSHGENWAQVELCHMGSMQFTFSENKSGLFTKSELSCEAYTSTVGAGFHAAAIDFTDALVASEKLKIAMEDETEYYNHRDFERMRREHFYNWLGKLVDHCKRSENEQSNLCLCWDLDQYMAEDIVGTVVTPFGRFNIKDITSLVEHDGIEAFAKEFFLWNEQAQDARFYRNCALSLLWEHCYFQPGNRSETDNIVNQRIIDLLEQSIKLDASISVPKAEYALLCTLQNHASVDLSKISDYQSTYPIGYRRSMVTYHLGNTNITLHGSFLMEENENSTLWFDGLEDNWHSLRVSAFTIREGETEFSPKIFNGVSGTVEDFDAGDGKGRASYAGELQDDNGESYYQSIAQIICQQQTTLITASYQHIEEKSWAMNLFRQIKAHINR